MNKFIAFMLLLTGIVLAWIGHPDTGALCIVLTLCFDELIEAIKETK
jgi:hypothetical protein